MKNIFEAAWSDFLATKTIETEKVGLEEYWPYEFSLLEEFSHQQAERYRQYDAAMDRYKGCRPYRENSVILENGTAMSASWIHLLEAHPFIAIQAPLKSKVAVFWEMVIEKEIDQIVMVTELKEKNRAKELAFPYWPLEVNQTLFLNENFKVTCTEFTCLFPKNHQCVEARKLKIESSEGERFVTHYWYRQWMDDTAPCQYAIRDFLELVSKERSRPSSPILVHCSAGIGRTGVFLALYYFMHANALPKSDFFNLVAYLRWQRPYAVAVYPQYRFCYEMLDTYC